jgi:hypothetical protein
MTLAAHPKLNPKLTDAANALRLGVHQSTISRKRKLAGIAPKNPRIRRDWRNVDWKMSDPEIATALGCSSRTVCSARSRFGQPKVLKVAVDWPGVDWRRSNLDIARELHVSAWTVKQRRAKHGHGIKRAGRPSTGAERALVDEWLDLLRIPKHDGSRRLSHVERIRIALDRLEALQAPAKRT